MKRATLKTTAIDAPPRESDVRFVTSGSYLLDLVLGGGWCCGRVANIVGDRSSGKTLLAIESCANFAQAGSPNHVRYAEAESAMDDTYADSIGMPKGIQRTADGDIDTVEQFTKDFLAFIRSLHGNHPAEYVLDSLDALSNDAEMKRGIGEATYGMEKPKLLSEFFRKHVREISEKNCALIVISQVRDNIGVTFGERHKRSGGKALDFYCSQILWLSEVGKITRTIHGEKRVTGVNIRARTKKNKVGMPFRECELPLFFNYGIDDELSMLDWMHDHKCLDRIDWDVKTSAKLVADLKAMREEQDRGSLKTFNRALRRVVGERWEEIEESLRPPMRKYG